MAPEVHRSAHSEIYSPCWGLCCLALILRFIQGERGQGLGKVTLLKNRKVSVRSYPLKNQKVFQRFTDFTPPKADKVDTLKKG